MAQRTYTQSKVVPKGVKMLVPGEGCIGPKEVEALNLFDFFNREMREQFIAFIEQTKYNGKLLKYVEYLFQVLYKNYRSIKRGSSSIEMMKPMQSRLFIDLIYWITSDQESELIKDHQNIRLCYYPVELCSKTHEHHHNEYFTHYDMNTLYLGMKICEAILQAFC